MTSKIMTLADSFFYKKDSSLPVGPSPINSERGSSEKQDREEPTLSLAALKCNLIYADAKRAEAYLKHMNAMTEYYQALDAYNQAIVAKNR